jgi:hypothetical protein
MSKLALAGLLSSLVVALGAGVAAAEILVSETNLRGTLRALTFEGAGTSVICEVTLSIRLRGRTLSATRGAAIGEAEELASESRCSGGHLRFLNARGGNVVETVSFREGVLRMQIDGVGLLIEAFGGLGRCLYRGNVQLTNSADPIRSLKFDETISIPLSRNDGFTCPAEGAFKGTLGIGEVAYTETVARGRPLQPNVAKLEYGAIEQAKEVTFRNEWIVPITVTEKETETALAPRFIERAEVTECWELSRAGAIAERGTCKDFIRLFRPRAPGEAMTVNYDVNLIGVAVGAVPLEN